MQWYCTSLTAFGTLRRIVSGVRFKPKIEFIIKFLTADELFILIFPAMTEIDRIQTGDDFYSINICLN